MNFVLRSLVGPEGSETQIKNPEKVNFKPVELLNDIAFVYTKLQEIEYFCKAVVKDERSFKPEYLNLALRKLKINKRLENVVELEKFIQIIPQYS